MATPFVGREIHLRNRPRHKISGPQVPRCLPPHSYRKLKQIHNANHNSNATHKKHSHIAKNICPKLNKNNAMITQAGKGKTTVIIYKQDYHNKVHTFFLENNFQPLPKKPTKKDQTHITRTLQQCNIIVHNKQMKQLIQKNPSTPLIKA